MIAGRCGRDGHRPRLPALLLIIVALVTSACGREEPPLRIMAAASLRGVMEDLAARYELAHPGASVRIETGGSLLLARRVRDLDVDVDVLFLADAALFGELLQPDWTSFHLRYAADRMVLGYTDESIGADMIDRDSWTDVIARSDVSVAMADPSRAPAGYRTIAALRLYDLLWPGDDLEELVVAKVGQRHLRANVAELLAPLQAGAVDYAFLYGATASRPGQPPRPGAPVIYGVSVPGGALGRSRSIEFLRLALGKEGRQILSDGGLTPVLGEDRPVGFGMPADIEALLASTR